MFWKYKFIYIYIRIYNLMICLWWNFCRKPKSSPILSLTFRMSRPEMFCKKGVFRNFTKFTEKHLYQSLFFNKVTGLGQQLWLEARNFIEKETLVQMFFCEFCEISQNTFLYRTPLVAASDRKTAVLQSLFN